MIALGAPKVHCPNCGYEGRARVVGRGCGMWLLWLALLVVSFFFLPLFLVTVPMFFWLAFSTRTICRACSNPHVVRLRRWRKMQGQLTSGERR